MALWLVPRIGLRKAALAEVFAYWCSVADASTIDGWLEAVAGSLGAENLLDLLIDTVSRDPASAIRARYFVSKYMPNGGRPALVEQRLRELDERIEQAVRRRPELAALRGPEARLGNDGRMLFYAK